MSSNTDQFKKPQHWSLHREEDRYELLAQIRPTDAYDDIIVAGKVSTAIEMLHHLIGLDGRRPAGTAQVDVVWFESEWVAGGAGLLITKVQVPDREGDDVMIVATVALAPIAEAAK